MSVADTEARTDTDAGKFVIWIAGGIGVAAVVAYGTYQLQRRADSRAETPATSAATDRADVIPHETLTASVAIARDTWDIGQLSEVEQELVRAEGRTSNQPDAHALRLARAEAVSTRALEAAIRAGTVAGDKLAAQAVADRAVVDGRALLNRIDSLSVDPTRLGAAEATLALAAGEDIGESYPVVLMPTYHDPSLRLASVAQPLWRGESVPEEDLGTLATELRAIKNPNGLTYALLAVTLDAQGDAEGALASADAILAEVPLQPFALGMRAKHTQVASAAKVAGPPAEPAATPTAEVHKPTAEPPSAAPEPSPVATPAAEPKADKPKADKPKADEPKADEPKADEPKADEPKADKPKADKPKAGKPKAGRPKPDAAKSTRPRGFDQLLAEGCKLAKTADAEAGFKMLKKAHDISPGGTKVTLCMAQAQAKLGRDSSARAFVDRVLRASARNKTALLLAAKLDAKAGNTSSALKLYRRVLEVDADNATALSYVEKNG